MVLFAGCSGGTAADRDFEGVFRAAGELPVVEEGVVEEPLGEVAVEADDTYYCTTRSYSRTEGRADQPVFNPAAGVLYPGNLVQGGPITEGVLQPIPLERGPGTVVVDLVNGSTTPGVEVAQANFLSIAEAMNTIIAETPDELPARTRYSMQQVRSAEELAIAIGVEFETIGFALEGDFAYQESSAYNRFVVKLTQEYYTLVFDLPTSYDDFFAPDVTADDLATYVRPGNPAAFVHSVTYGRAFYLLIQSTDSVQAMEASIDASFSAVAAGGSLSAEASYISELSDLSIGGWAEGGDARLAAGALQGDFDALSAFVTDGGTITTGVPLSYVVRSVNRPDRILNIGRADEYSVRECVPVGTSLDAPILGYDGDFVESENIGINVPVVTRWPSLFDESGTFDGVPPNLPYAGFVVANGVNNRGDYVAFQGDSTFDGRIVFPGSAFRDSDYSIFTVVDNPHAPGQTDRTYWMWSPANGEGTGIHLGFEGTDVVFSHGGDTELVVPMADDRLATFFVFSVVYDEEGPDGVSTASLYQNGVLLGTLEDVPALVSFNSASLGAANADRFPTPYSWMDIGNVQAYGIAATETQRRYVEDRLIERYGL
jgi:hypothetical protein